MWTKVTKPTVDGWTGVSKPATLPIYSGGEPIGLLLALTYTTITQEDEWTSVPKPTNASWTKVSKPI